jgi:aspartyl/glutamyl-tRNA(Asn/Gln) amidotransferase, A subunit
MTNYLNLTIREINNLLKTKKIKPLDLVLEAYEKIEKNNLNDFITLNKEEALKQAKALENKEVDNLFFGIPIAIKDNIITKGLKTTAASKTLENFEPIYDATVVEKIKEKNMIIIGKTNMDEFAMGSTGETSYFGATKNPINDKKIPGGSSSGSAASVRSLEVSVSLGSDTGGSIRQPASFCGIVGMKPTYGRVSRYGLISFGSSLDQIGPMTKTVEDNAILLELISGKDSKDSTSSGNEVETFINYLDKDINGMKIAIPNYYMSELIDKEVKEQIIKITKILETKGCIIDYIDIPYLEYAIPLYQTIALGEASSNLARYDGIKYGHITEKFENIEDLYKKTRAESFGNEVKRRIMVGSYVLSGKNADVYYKKALKVRRAMKESFDKIFEDYDLIIGPTNTGVAYDLETKKDDALKSFYDDLLTIPVNMAGLPALSMPVGKNSEGLPIGIHIIGKSFDEKTIYKLASQIEKEVGEKIC